MSNTDFPAGPAADPSRSFVATEFAAQMDPRLQRILARRNRGLRLAASASSDVDEVPVIAKVTDAAAWERLSEVRPGARIGGKGSDGTTIVTGRIPVNRIEAVRTQSFVKSLKAAQPLQPVLAAGVTETHAGPAQLPAGTLGNGGKDVVVGIVDYGCDFAHRNFIAAGNRTRLISIWHQGGITTPTSPFGYGREYKQEQINAALNQADPYAVLGYGPAPDVPLRPRGTHGTHVMDIAAGNGGGSNVAGFAPNAELVFVDVSHADVPFFGQQVVGSSFGDSTRLLEAIDYIFEKAGSRPCVINISLGTNGGPHDGTTLVEEGIDRLLAEAPNRAITIAGSNSFSDGIHARGVVPEGGEVDLVWRVPFSDATHNEFELWYDGDDRISMEIIAPSGQSLGTIQPGLSGTITNNGAVEVFAANRLNDPNNGDNMIGVFLERTAASGAWRLRFHGDSISSGAFHAWIERDDSSPSSFAPPHDNTHTIGSISCGRLALAVASYDAHKPQRPISFFSSAGPTRDGRNKPEISAPGHDVLAAHSRTFTGVVSKSGTSMAAPAVAGIVALMLGEARARGFDLTAADIRDIVIASARRSPPGGTAWNDRYGNGRIDAAAAVAGVIQLASGGRAPSSKTVAGRKSAAGKRKRSASKPGRAKSRKKGTA